MPLACLTSVSCAFYEKGINILDRCNLLFKPLEAVNYSMYLWLVDTHNYVVAKSCLSIFFEKPATSWYNNERMSVAPLAKHTNKAPRNYGKRQYTRLKRNARYKLDNCIYMLGDRQYLNPWRLVF